MTEILFRSVLRLEYLSQGGPILGELPSLTQGLGAGAVDSMVLLPFKTSRQGSGDDNQTKHQEFTQQNTIAIA